VPAFDDGLLRILATFEHLSNVLGEVVVVGILVYATVFVTEQLEILTLPTGRMFSDAPEQGVGLGVLERGIDRLEEILHRLRYLRIPVRGTVPVVDDPVVLG
jgi:hypothetical protein